MIRTLLALALCYCVPAYGEALYEAKGSDGVRVVAYSDACALRDVITNLPKRATWHDGSKVYEGCFGATNGLVIFYFADKTVVVLPTQAFTRVQGT